MPSGRTAPLARDFSEQAAEHFAEVDRTGKPKLFIPRASNAVPDGNNVSFDFDSIEEAFPDVDPGVEPLGSLVLVMIRQPKLRAGSMELMSDARKTEHDNTQVAKVIALGPLCFHSRDTYQPWPEGAWCKVGDFVKVPKYQGDPWAVAYQRTDTQPAPEEGGVRHVRVTDFVRFAMFKDLALLGRYPDATAALMAKAFY
jgi:hypothetical protein